MSNDRPNDTEPNPITTSATPVDDATEAEQLYTPAPGERQLTVRAVVTGCLIGGVVGAMNISLGLKIGWSFGGSIIAAILGYAFWLILRPRTKYTVMETNITQTSGSASGAMASAAGLLAPIPALAMLDEPVVLGYFELTLWALAVGFLGVFFAVPLRRQMVVVDKLRFPTGTACAETIVSIFAEGAEAVRKARVLMFWSVVAAVYVLMIYLYPGLNGPSADLMGPAGLFLAAWGFKLSIGPALLGGGLLIGPRVGISLLLGAIVGYLVLGWGIIAPLGLVEGPLDTWSGVASSRTGIRSWILWPGVAIMVADALTSLGLSWRSILNTFTSRGSADVDELDDPNEQIPNKWWLGGLAVGTVTAVVIAQVVFKIPWWMTLIAVALSSVLAAIAVRCAGETDINPIGGMGKVTQLGFGGMTNAMNMAPTTAIPTNLMAAAITGAGASQAADMMQDLKTGRMLGASPRKQIIAQCFGIIAGILVVVPVYKIFERVHDIGADDSEYSAPAAHAWKAVAEVMSSGFENLPQGTPWAMLAGVILGVLLPVLRRYGRKISPYVPSGLAFGIAFIVYPYDSISLFLGAMLYVLWKANWPVSCKALVFAVASGLLVGEGLMNVGTALIELVVQSVDTSGGLVSVWQQVFGGGG